MEWTGHGIVLGVRQHGETSVILDVLTRERGRQMGYVHGGRSRRLRAALQAGNSLDFVWRSRIEEQLGKFTIEPRRQRAARIMASAVALHALHHLCALARLLAEREPHLDLHDLLEAIVEAMDEGDATAAAVILFELRILGDLGYGLSLDRCAASGTREDLVYVSPKSGCAVSRAAGEPYHDRLLPLPRFVVDDAAPPSREDLADGFRLAGFFLERDLFGPRGLDLPDARAAYVRRWSEAQ